MAIVLEVALELVARPLTRDVVVALFDTEEQPYAGTPGMGSIRFHDHQMDGRGMACAVIQDLTGHDVSLRFGGKQRRLPRIRNLLFMTGAESHAELAGAVAACRRPRRLPLIAVLNRYIGDVSDHRPFRHAGQSPTCSSRAAAGSTTTGRAIPRSGSTTARCAASPAT